MQYQKLAVLVVVAIAQILAPKLVAQEDLTASTKQPRYRLVDIGTFGGPAGIVFGGTGNSNQHKTLVTSCADTADLDPNWPNVNPGFGDDQYIQHAFLTTSGHLTDLGTLPGGTSSCGQGVNTRGMVAGFSTNGVIDPLTGFPEIEAVVWRDGEVLDLGNFGGNGSFANFLNNRGQVVGGAFNSIPDPFVSPAIFVYGATQMHAFLWQDGVMQDLGTLGGPDSIAVYINEHGEVAGQSFTNDITNPVTGVPTLDPFLWRNGQMLDLGSLGGTFGFPEALNNRGQVVGESNLPGDETFHPFLWEKGKMHDLGTLGGNFGFASGINDDGVVVGTAYFPGDERWDAVLWQNGKIMDLGNLGCTSRGLAINAKRQVVGTSRLADCATVHGMLWQQGKMYDLNDLIPPGASLELVEPLYINDVGVIAGRGFPPGCDDFSACGHTFLLFPCEEDDSRGCQNEVLDRGESSVNAPSPTLRKEPSLMPLSNSAKSLMGAWRTRSNRRRAEEQ